MEGVHRGYRAYKIATVVCGTFAVVFAAGFLRLWVDGRQAPAPVQAVLPAAYRTVQPLATFLDAAEVSLPDDRGLFLDARGELLAEHKDFVEVDLQSMKVTLYRAGEAVETLPVLSKGREGSWWETPTGLYAVLGKEANHFSSIGEVWMPWSVQFYGNFFIHGWPYHRDGTPVAKTYSGGCVRLSSEDAKKVYEFVAKGTPIVLFDDGSKPLDRPHLAASAAALPPPAVSAKAALVADLDTGEILLDKNAGDALPVASLTKLMTATVASEIIYLGRSVAITPAMLADPIQSYPLETGGKYLMFDLLYPLLMESSNGTARAYAHYLGEGLFVRQMNEKAKTLGMRRTAFADPAGIGAGNVSTLKDMARLAKYIVEKRRFLFDISRGKPYEVFGPSELSRIRNHNEFTDDPRLVGVKNGETQAAGQTLLAVWRFTDAAGAVRTIVIAVLGSPDRARDGAVLRDWVVGGFGLR